MIKRTSTLSLRVKVNLFSQEAESVVYGSHFDLCDVASPVKRELQIEPKMVTTVFYTDSASKPKLKREFTLQDVINQGRDAEQLIATLNPGRNQFKAQCKVNKYTKKHKMHKDKEDMMSDKLARMKISTIKNYVNEKEDTIVAYLNHLNGINNSVKPIHVKTPSEAIHPRRFSQPALETLITQPYKEEGMSTKKPSNLFHRSTKKHVLSPTYKSKGMPCKFRSALPSLETSPKSKWKEEEVYDLDQIRSKFKKKIQSCRRLSTEIERSLVSHRKEKDFRMTTSNLIEKCSQMIASNTNFKKLYMKTQREVDKHLKILPSNKFKLAQLFSQNAYAKLINKTRKERHQSRIRKLIGSKNDVSNY